MKADFLQRNTKIFIAGWLVFWLSGIIFLFCCENRARAAKRDSCPLAKASHCDKKSGEDPPQPASLQNGNRAFDCCILPKILDKSRKLEQKPQPALQAKNVKISSPVFIPPRIESSLPKAYFSHDSNRSRTYLKNRVFRI
jgi:hypothetical protein